MRLLYTLLALFMLQNISAQTGERVKFYDSTWVETTKEKGVYYTQYITTDLGYKATSYWVKSGKVRTIMFYTDTTFSKVKGLAKEYYESGQIEDSSFYNDESEMINSYYYYPNGNRWVHYIYDPKTKKEITEAYDENNNFINNFIYFREAAFPGGIDEWRSYLVKNLKTKVPVKKGAPKGQYQVTVRFIVNVNGKLARIEPETNLGFGMEEELMRVIKKSPKWIPAIRLNKAISAFRRQPLVFVVSEE